MEQFASPFQEELIHGEMPFWDFASDPFDLATVVSDLLAPTAEEPEGLPCSAFAKYSRPEGGFSIDGLSGMRSTGRKNIHHRVIDLMRRIRVAQAGNKTGEGSKEFRHMMRERHRREKLSQCYADLHSILPYRSKGDKNSIVQSAAIYVKELKGVREELLRHNEKLKMSGVKHPNLEGEKIKIRLSNPMSALDSMIGALHCLKAMDVKARAIQTEFSGPEPAAVMSIQSKVGASQVERAVEQVLEEQNCYFSMKNPILAREKCLSSV